MKTTRPALTFSAFNALTVPGRMSGLCRGSDARFGGVFVGQITREVETTSDGQSTRGTDRHHVTGYTVWTKATEEEPTFTTVKAARDYIRGLYA